MVMNLAAGYMTSKPCNDLDNLTEGFEFIPMKFKTVYNSVALERQSYHEIENA